MWIFLLLTACAAQPLTPAPTPTGGGQLTPYHTPQATLTRTPAAPTAAALPSPTATPRVHTIKRGDTLGTIAYLYHVTVAALLAANPTVNPNLLVVGSTLVVPASSQAPTLPAGALPSPTPVPVTLSPVNCQRAADGGAWCFVLARNQTGGDLEGLSALIRMADGDGNITGEQVAAPPLNILPDGGILPLSAYFPGPVPRPFQASAELLTSLPLPAGDDRYLPARADGIQVNLQPDGLSAAVRGTVHLKNAKAAAGRVWVAAVALDSSGQPLGVRRWESGQTLPAGGALEFSLTVYSAGARIERVEVLVEAGK